MTKELFLMYMAKYHGFSLKALADEYLENDELRRRVDIAVFRIKPTDYFQERS